MRNLERELSNLIRKAVKDIILTKKKRIAVTDKNLPDFLGVPKYRYGEVEGGGPGRCRHRSGLDGSRRRDR